MERSSATNSEPSWKANIHTRGVGLVLLLCAMSGCGQEGLELFPVEGVVTLDGTPVSDAAVMFLSDTGGHIAHGVTDAQGRYQLETANRPGAVSGESKVAVSKQITNNPYADGGIGPLEIEWIIPKQYSRPETSGLTATVEPDSLEFPFALTSP